MPSRWRHPWRLVRGGLLSVDLGRHGALRPVGLPWALPRSRWALVWPVLLACLMVLPRVVDLGADAWPDLCWGSGIWTDEGFYTHNARNAVLFGDPVQDEFNNRILAPWLDGLHRWIFRIWGVSLETVRWPSVIAGLGCIPVFWVAMRCRFGSRIAATATVFFGLEVSFLFTNRIGLMESVGVLLHCIAFLAFATGRPLGWFVSGMVAMACVSLKTTFLILLPLPVLVWLWSAWRERSPWLVPVAAYGAGALCALVAYLAWWGIPNGAEIVRMNNFYRERQSQPRSWMQLLWMIRRGLIGYQFGLFQRLLTRTPILSILALIGLLGGCRLWSVTRLRASTHPGKRRSRAIRPRREAERLLWLWFAAGVVFLLVSRYAPARYYLVMHPAMAGLAAITAHRLPSWIRLWRKQRRARFPILATGFLLGFHSIQPALQTVSALRPWSAWLGGAAGAALATAFAAILPRLEFRPGMRDAIPAAALGLFVLGSVGQLGWWWTHRTYETRQLSRELASFLPPGSRLAGDWAPNLCIENKIRAMPVFRGLANDRDPIGRFRPDAVLVGQTPFPIALWKELAPAVVVEENRLTTLRFHGLRLNLYRVPKELR